MSATDHPLPRWTFQFRNGETEPYAASALEIHDWPGFPPKVTQLQAMTPGDVVRVSVSHDSYKAALDTALEKYAEALT